jgi:hypothetical protein
VMPAPLIRSASATPHELRSSSPAACPGIKRPNAPGQQSPVDGPGDLVRYLRRHARHDPGRDGLGIELGIECQHFVSSRRSMEVRKCGATRDDLRFSVDRCRQFNPSNIRSDALWMEESNADLYQPPYPTAVLDPKQTLDGVADQYRTARERERPTSTGPQLISSRR